VLADAWQAQHPSARYGRLPDFLQAALAQCGRKHSGGSGGADIPSALSEGDVPVRPNALRGCRGDADGDPRVAGQPHLRRSTQLGTVSSAVQHAPDDTPRPSTLGTATAGSRQGPAILRAMCPSVTGEPGNDQHLMEYVVALVTSQSLQYQIPLDLQAMVGGDA
jgi:hypothetical protein